MSLSTNFRAFLLVASILALANGRPIRKRKVLRNLSAWNKKLPAHRMAHRTLGQEPCKNRKIWSRNFAESITFNTEEGVLQGGDLASWGANITAEDPDSVENPTDIGVLRGFCVRMPDGVSWDCHETWMFEEGWIFGSTREFDGGVVFNQTFVAGTGVYDGVYGSNQLHAPNEAGVWFSDMTICSR